MWEEVNRVERWKHQLTRATDIDVTDPVTSIELSEEESWEISGGAVSNTCGCCQNTCGQCCGAASTCTCSCGPGN
jgi:hypothetical protein